MWTCQQLILILPKMNKIKKNYQIEELFKNQNCILEAVNGRLETINEKLDEGQINEINAVRSSDGLRNQPFLWVASW